VVTKAGGVIGGRILIGEEKKLEARGEAHGGGGRGTAIHFQWVTSRIVNLRVRARNA